MLLLIGSSDCAIIIWREGSKSNGGGGLKLNYSVGWVGGLDVSSLRMDGDYKLY